MSPAVGFQDATAIAGIAQTAFSKHLEPTEAELACTVIVDACADAGIDPSEIDALCSYTMEATEEVDIVRNIGCGEITFFSQVGYGGGAGCGVVGHAAMAVATGQAEVAVAWRSRKRGSGPRPWTSTSVQLRVPGAWTRPFGMLRPVDEIAMLTRRYMHEYGATRDHLANVAMAVRKHANMNPAAIMYDKPMSREDYMASRWVSEPLVPVRQLPRDRRRPGVRHRVGRAGPRPPAPAGRTSTPSPRGCRPSTRPWSTSSTTTRSPDRRGRVPGGCGRTPPSGPRTSTWRRSTTPSRRSSCCRSRATDSASAVRRGPMTENGNLEWEKGSLPVNTAGGGLSEAYVHGFNLINEGVRQMRGTSTAQVDGAETCLVTSGEGVPTSALLLRR